MSEPVFHPKDYPFEEIAEAVERHANKGNQCFQKFTCAKCGARQTMEEPNVLYTRGICEECGFTTNIAEKGCNYMLHISIKIAS